MSHDSRCSVSFSLAAQDAPRRCLDYLSICCSSYGTGLYTCYQRRDLVIRDMSHERRCSVSFSLAKYNAARTIIQ
jgi:hypothetical protein